MKNQTTYINLKMINSIVPIYKENALLFDYKKGIKFIITLRKSGFYDLFGQFVPSDQIKLNTKLYIEYLPIENVEVIYYKPHIIIRLLDKTHTIVWFETIDEMNLYMDYLNKIVSLFKIN